MSLKLHRVYIPRAACAVVATLTKEGALVVQPGMEDRLALELAALFISEARADPEGGASGAVEDWRRMEPSAGGGEGLDASASSAAKVLLGHSAVERVDADTSSMSKTIAEVLRQFQGLPPELDRDIRQSLTGWIEGTPQWEEAYHQQVKARAASS